MSVSIKFWHVFGLSWESVESQPVFGHQRGETADNACIYFFDGYIFNIPFFKIMIGEVYGLLED